MILEKQLLLTIKSMKGSKAISKQSEVYRSTLRDYSQVQSVQDNCQSSQECMSLQIHLKVRTCSPQRNCKIMQMLHFGLHKPNKYGLFGRVTRRKPLLIKRIWQHRLDLQSWLWTNNICPLDENKTEMFGFLQTLCCASWANTAYQHKHFKLTIKHGGGGAMILGFYFAATWSGHLAVTESITNSAVYQSIPESDVVPSVWQLYLGPNCFMDQNNHPKHRSKSTTKLAEIEKCCSDSIKVQTSAQLKCCGRILRKQRYSIYLLRF